MKLMYWNLLIINPKCFLTLPNNNLDSIQMTLSQKIIYKCKFKKEIKAGIFLYPKDLMSPIKLKISALIGLKIFLKLKKKSKI